MSAVAFADALEPRWALDFPAATAAVGGEQPGCFAIALEPRRTFIFQP